MMITVKRGYRHFSVVRKLLAIIALIAWAASMGQNKDPGIAVFPILFVITLVSWFEFRQWDIDPDSGIIKFTDSKKVREIKRTNISQVIPHWGSIRVFYNDGTDVSIPLVGLSGETKELIKETLN